MSVVTGTWTWQGASVIEREDMASSIGSRAGKAIGTFFSVIGNGKLVPPGLSLDKFGLYRNSLSNNFRRLWVAVGVDGLIDSFILPN